ncbi:hypothetical protein [Chryseobacterium sp. ZHDP1]|uniref:hypothetical protein n=1 Tax=Chryseobacterium sp. ZHDP1 TaxID=2838877 RepID=UPI001BDFC930|nr:hypothetical protein [Chryseobacterium sp. ZHDP1]QWA38852.1 hypothetical protein KKI44_01170 [Chryseobacterium sp. ZHDP1]
MKISTSKLSQELEKVRAAVEKREKQFENRSERWQESEAGETFQSKTAELEEIECDLEAAIEALEFWNEEN